MSILRKVTIYIWIWFGIVSIFMALISFNSEDWMWFIVWLFPSQILLYPSFIYWKERIK